MKLIHYFHNLTNSRYKYINDNYIRFNYDYVSLTNTRDNLPINILPEHIHKIEFYFRCPFNQHIDNLAHSIKICKFSIIFNQNIDNLPQNLFYIDFFVDFNKTINNLPNSLRVLKLASEFSKFIDKLPSNLHTLVLSNNFNKPLYNLPKYLHTLDVGNDFNNYLDFLPESLQILIIYKNYRIFVINDLPSSIKHIVVREDQKNIVNNIYKSKIINYIDYYNHYKN